MILMIQPLNAYCTMFHGSNERFAIYSTSPKPSSKIGMVPELVHRDVRLPLVRDDDSIIGSSRNAETKSLHAAPVLLDHTLTFFLRVARSREQHAFVTGSFFVFTNAARLGFRQSANSLIK